MGCQDTQADTYGPRLIKTLVGRYSKKTLGLGSVQAPRFDAHGEFVNNASVTPNALMYILRPLCIDASRKAVESDEVYLTKFGLLRAERPLGFEHRDAPIAAVQKEQADLRNAGRAPGVQLEVH